MKKPKLKKYPIGGTKGFIPDTMVHYIGAGEVPYSKDQLSSMGYNYETSTGGFDEYSKGNNRRFYKTISPGTPEWNNPENPYLTSTASTQPVVKQAPKLKWPTRTDYSKGSKGPIYSNPTFAGGGEYTPIPEKDSLYIEDKLKRDPYLSAKYKYKVVEDRKKGDILYRTMPNGKDVPVNFTNMRELDRQAYKVKMDRDLEAAGQKPIYNVFAPPTFKHGGMKLPKYYNGGEPVVPAAYGQADALNGSIDSIAGQATPWYGMAKGASNMGKSMVNTDEYGNPITTQDKQLDAVLTPQHEHIMNDVTQGNYGKAAATVFLPGIAYESQSNALGLKKPIDKMFGATKTKGQTAKEQAEFADSQKAIYEQSLKDNMYYTYAQGGIHSGMPNAEVEKQEVMRMPDGSTTQVDGPTHESGGIPVNIPDGTQIFSDRLKDPTTKKTFAKMAEKYKIKDADDKANHLAKSSKELVDQIKQRKLDELFAKQESLKQVKLNKYAQKLGLDPTSMFKNGGTKLPKFDGGGTWVNGVWVPNSTTNYGYSTPEGTFTADGTKTADSYGQPVGFDSPLPMITNQDLENRNNVELRAAQDASIPKIQDVNSISKSNTGRKMNPNWIEPATNTLMQNVGNLMYLKDQGKKYDKQDFYKYSPELYNPADALRQADIEARVTRDRLKDATGGNAGALMSNLQQSQAINTLNKSKIRTDASNMNNQILNDAQLRNIQGKYSVDDINARNKGQALTNYYKAIQGIGANTTAAYTDWKHGNMDKNTANMLSSMFSNYGLDMNNPNDWKIFLKKALNK